MKKQGYYSTGEFMNLAHITKKTVRYYDEKNILKPSYVDPDTGYRFYTEDDLARMQQILLLKYLGFSLADIKEMTINQSDSIFMEESLRLQLKLVEERKEQLQIVVDTIKDTAETLLAHKKVDWSRSLEIIHEIGLEQSLKNQYLNASNISARINLHSLYSQNKQGWFPWIFSQCQIKKEMNILELGCGDGTFWQENLEQIPESVRIVLSDRSEGMLRDAKRTIGSTLHQFDYLAIDCHKIPYPDETFDLVIANHLLFYCDNIPQVLAEISRVLKNGGTLVASTYGKDHMKEIRELTAKFDDRIVLSDHKLYEEFGRENGSDLLAPFFETSKWLSYEDSLLVPQSETLISYVLSCHGNQNQYIIDRYNEFRQLVQKNTEKGFHITKDAGIFIANK